MTEEQRARTVEVVQLLRKMEANGLTRKPELVGMSDSELVEYLGSRHYDGRLSQQQPEQK